MGAPDHTSKARVFAIDEARRVSSRLHAASRGVTVHRPYHMTSLDPVSEALTGCGRSRGNVNSFVHFTLDYRLMPQIFLGDLLGSMGK